MPDQGLQTFWKGADDGAVLDYHGRGPYAWSGPGYKRLRSLRLKKKLNLVLTKYLVCLCVRSAGSAVTGASCGGADGGCDGEGVGEGVGGARGAPRALKFDKILVGLGDFGQTPGPSSVLFGGCGCGCCVFVSLLFSAHLINCAQLIN